MTATTFEFQSTLQLPDLPELLREIRQRLAPAVARALQEVDLPSLDASPLDVFERTCTKRSAFPDGPAQPCNPELHAAELKLFVHLLSTDHRVLDALHSRSTRFLARLTDPRPPLLLAPPPGPLSVLAAWIRLDPTMPDSIKPWSDLTATLAPQPIAGDLPALASLGMPHNLCPHPFWASEPWATPPGRAEPWLADTLARLHLAAAFFNPDPTHLLQPERILPWLELPPQPDCLAPPPDAATTPDADPSLRFLTAAWTEAALLRWENDLSSTPSTPSPPDHPLTQNSRTATPRIRALILTACGRLLRNVHLWAHEEHPLRERAGTFVKRISDTYPPLRSDLLLLLQLARYPRAAEQANEPKQQRHTTHARHRAHRPDPCKRITVHDSPPTANHPDAAPSRFP